VTSGLNGFSATATEIYRGRGVRIGEESYEQETCQMFVGWKSKYGKTYRMSVRSASTGCSTPPLGK
jgi:hypothetical protein